MESVIIYASRNPGKDRVAVTVPGSNFQIYIRTERFEGSMSDALDNANPQPDEAVSNTHSLDGIEE